MALNGKCNPGDLCMVLSKKTKPSRQVFETPFGGAIRPCYYETDDAYILTPSTDIEDPRFQSITDAINLAKEVLVQVEEQGRSIIIPVAEQQKICYRPRDHWVTLHYNPKSKTCTLIDSRHWVLSYLYPVNNMFDMFVNGLNAIGIDTNGIVFNQMNQNVQMNDIFCGAWTLMNSLTLAGAVEDRSPPESMEALRTLFWEVNEVDVINQIIDFSECPVTQKLNALAVSRLQQSLIFFGLSSYPQPVDTDLSEKNEHKLE